MMTDLSLYALVSVNVHYMYVSCKTMILCMSSGLQWRILYMYVLLLVIVDVNF